METRKITVVSTRDQKRTVVETDATTLGELKSALSNAGVSYADMTFYEALTRTELTQDESLLPHDVSYKGNITNELVFMLTNPNKKIKSGALSEARLAMYDEIVRREFADAIRAKYGKNYTNCSNAELVAFLEEQAQPTPSCKDEAARKAIEELVDILCDNDYLSESEAASVVACLNDEPAPASAAPYSEDELNELMATMPGYIR